MIKYENCTGKKVEDEEQKVEYRFSDTSDGPAIQVRMNRVWRDICKLDSQGDLIVCVHTDDDIRGCPLNFTKGLENCNHVRVWTATGLYKVD